MSKDNKYGDKVEGMAPPKEEKKVEQPVTEPAKESLTTKQTQPPRPNSNFSRTLEEAKPQVKEPKLGDRVKMRMTEYVMRMKDAKDVDEIAAAQSFFFSLIRSIVKQKDYIIFNAEWTSLINFCRVNAADVNYITISRAVYRWNLNATEQKQFSTLALLATTSAHSSNPRSIKTLSGDAILGTIASMGKEATYNIGAYYTFA